MTMTQRLMNQGRLLKAKEDRSLVELEMRTLVTRIGELVDPFIEFRDLALDEATVVIGRLRELQTKYRALTDQIDRLEAELYG